MPAKARFDEVLDAVEGLSADQQAELMEIGG